MQIRLYGEPRDRNTLDQVVRQICWADAMRAVRVSEIRRLPGLKNISWLTSRQLNRLAEALNMSQVKRRGIVFDKKCSPEAAYVLLSGVARITCRNRKGDRTLVMMVAPGVIPGIPPAVSGIRYDFRCEAITDCQIGAVTLATFIEIALVSPRQTSSAWLPAIPGDGIWCSCAVRISWLARVRSRNLQIVGSGSAIRNFARYGAIRLTALITRRRTNC